MTGCLRRAMRCLLSSHRHGPYTKLWDGPPLPLRRVQQSPAKPEEQEGPMMNIAVVGIDLGKNSGSLVALDDNGAVVKRRRMRRESIAEFTAKLGPCIVAMEACCGAHHLARRLKSQGHEVRLMSPEYVRPYVKAQKNDDRDAEAIAEAT